MLGGWEVGRLKRQGKTDRKMLAQVLHGVSASYRPLPDLKQGFWTILYRLQRVPLFLHHFLHKKSV